MSVHKAKWHTNVSPICINIPVGSRKKVFTLQYLKIFESCQMTVKTHKSRIWLHISDERDWVLLSRLKSRLLKT